jgi:hypothetical protein
MSEAAEVRTHARADAHEVAQVSSSSPISSIVSSRRPTFQSAFSE